MEARYARMAKRVAWLLPGVLVGLLVTLALGPAGAGATTCPDYNGTTVYPYPFDASLGAWDLPECREPASDRRTRDYGAVLPDPTMQRSLSTFEPNPAQGGRLRWSLLDSFGRSLAILERYSDRWVVTDPETGALVYTDTTLDSDELVVQGRGCMANDTLQSTYALVAFDANDRSTIPTGTSIVPYRIRAFIDQHALPADVQSSLDSYNAGCGDAFGRIPAAAATVHDPTYDSNTEKYYGEDGVARTYSNYNVKAPYKNARYFIINSTGVHGGGIVRGVVQAQDSVGQSDRFDYCDPNYVSSLSAPVADWLYGQIGATRMWGWLPLRCPFNAPAGVAPSNTSLPTISGNAQEGQTLTAAVGAWSGSDPINYRYQWRRCDAGGSGCADISGQTAATYLLVASDVGNTIRVRVTATNAYGASTAEAAQTAVVAAAPRTGAITGTVYNSGWRAIRKATVTCGTYTARTNAKGAYSIQPIPAGTYGCTAAASGYSSATQAGIAVAPGQVVSGVDFHLL
jgi:Carboxypeptidase regulatory-like domain